MKLSFTIMTLLTSLLLTSVANARGTYQTPEDFISQAFNGTPPKSKVLWIDDETKSVIESILAHSFRKMRLRYWQQDNQSVWIMDEIGKEAPITVGIHVKDNAISQTKVLVYRESRGDEVRHEFFTDQFKSAQLTSDLKLDTHIDGITGATLSVRALTKLSRIALYLDEQLTANN
ncbi:FMN-binding protein [Shewanella sp. MBTL60-007]|uniref:FMN-binding protein n=1 Tax=Shewanella sp. MBTL60-007 TaxID=2815911 RepID=UPI001BC3D70D|nr:FMN-binding protein [Shewanella sp. MBTL60-007]GIU16446.1 hypothetical protein TUM3792_10160 [Shewanella sp. MBTL60-007]